MDALNCRPLGMKFPIPGHSEQGSSVFELLAIAVIMAILFASIAPNLKGINDPLQNGSQELAGLFKQTRAKALQTTRAYLLQPVSGVRVQAGFANTCEEALADGVTLDPQLVLDLPNDVQLRESGWSVCYSARGTSNVNIELAIDSDEGRSRSLEVFLGGAVRLR